MASHRMGRLRVVDGRNEDIWVAGRFPHGYSGRGIEG